MPHLSIVIPAYDRERFIARAVDSCLNQDYADFEIVVVNDGSTDRTGEIVKAYSDPRIRLVGHVGNRGVGPARNTGVDASRGRWIVFLDSDDELLPGALSAIFRRSMEVGEDIQRLQFMGRTDDGRTSPDPPLSDECWDYEKYLGWMDSVQGRRGDSLPVIRRSTFDKVRFRSDRTLEGPYHLEFMKNFKAWAFPDVVARYHQDAENQLTKPDAGRSLESAVERASSGEILLREHGEALKAYAPNAFRNELAGQATLWFLAGRRARGIKYSFLSLALRPFSPRSWGTLLLGLIGPGPLARARVLRNRKPRQ